MSTILVVDDEYLICDILEFALEDAGYAVEKAISCRKALEILEKTRIDLVITDYMMPEMNGGELARALRAEPDFKNMPIILMSGAQASVGRESPGLFDKVLEKPFEPPALLNLIEELLAPVGD